MHRRDLYGKKKTAERLLFFRWQRTLMQDVIRLSAGNMHRFNSGVTLLSVKLITKTAAHLGVRLCGETRGTGLWRYDGEGSVIEWFLWIWKHHISVYQLLLICHIAVREESNNLRSTRFLPAIFLRFHKPRVADWSVDQFLRPVFYFKKMLFVLSESINSYFLIWRNFSFGLYQKQ